LLRWIAVALLCAGVVRAQTQDDLPTDTARLRELQNAGRISESAAYCGLLPQQTELVLGKAMDRAFAYLSAAEARNATTALERGAAEARQAGLKPGAPGCTAAVREFASLATQSGVTAAQMKAAAIGR